MVDGRSRRSRRIRAARREALLAAARAVFAKRGYHAASIADIVGRARVARGTFYLYFASKRAIFEELLDGLLRQLRAALRRVTVGEGAPPPVEQVRGNVERILDVLVEHRDLTRLLMHEAVGLDEDFDAKLRDFYDSVVQLIRGALALGQQAQLVRECDAGLTAYCILGSLKELVYQLLVVGGAGRFDRDAAARAVVDYNLRGVFRDRSSRPGST